MSKEKKYRCEIRANNFDTQQRCVYCGTVDEVPVPVWVFDKETGRPVCNECMKKYNPTAYEAIGAIYATINYVYQQDIKNQKYKEFFDESKKHFNETINTFDDDILTF